MKKYSIPIVSLLLALFGAITLFLTSSVIFDLFGIREMEGNFVPFVIGSNFIAGILYLVASIGFYKNKLWTISILMISAFLLIVTFGVLLMYIQAGGIHESKTIMAMLFRIIVTIGFSAGALLLLRRPKLTD